MTKTKIALFATPTLAAILIGAMLLPVHAQEEIKAEAITVTMDIKPGSCPNSINTNQKGLVSVAILGEQKLGDALLEEAVVAEKNRGEKKLDLREIKVESLKLNGVLSVKADFEDVATPYTGKISGERLADECHELGPDGFEDLVMKYETQALVKAIDRQHKTDQDVLTLRMTGELKDGTQIVAEDVIVKRDIHKESKVITKDKQQTIDLDCLHGDVVVGMDVTYILATDSFVFSIDCAKK